MYATEIGGKTYEGKQLSGKIYESKQLKIVSKSYLGRQNVLEFLYSPHLA